MDGDPPAQATDFEPAAGTTARPVIRPAAEADAEAIASIIEAADLNPRDLDWRRFLVAEDGGTVVACAQVRVHAGGTRELASVAVAEARQGEGLGRAISEAAIAREPTRPLYLYTSSSMAGYWQRFAFSTIDDAAIPEDLMAVVRFWRRVIRREAGASGPSWSLVVMRRDEA